MMPTAAFWLFLDIFFSKFWMLHLSPFYSPLAICVLATHFLFFHGAVYDIYLQSAGRICIYWRRWSFTTFLKHYSPFVQACDSSLPIRITGLPYQRRFTPIALLVSLPRAMHWWSFHKLESNFPIMFMLSVLLPIVIFFCGGGVFVEGITTGIMGWLGVCEWLFRKRGLLTGKGENCFIGRGAALWAPK